MAQIDIRIWNKEEKRMEYYYNAKLSGSGSLTQFSYTDDEGETRWVKKGVAMQRTPYEIYGEPLYERDVVLYMGCPCMVYTDQVDYNNAIFLDDTKYLIKDVIDDIELLGNVYETGESGRIAVENWKKNLAKTRIEAEVVALGIGNKDYQSGTFKLTSQDKGSLVRKMSFYGQDYGYAELYCINEALLELKLSASEASLVIIRVGNEFVRDMLNSPGIIRHWKNNGWKTKAGRDIVNKELWGNIYYMFEKYTIKAELLTEEEKEKMINYLKRK